MYCTLVVTVVYSIKKIWHQEIIGFIMSESYTLT